MTITAGARSSAPTAVGPPKPSQSSNDATQATITSPYTMALNAADSEPNLDPPHGGDRGRPIDASPPGAPDSSSQKPQKSHHRLDPAPVRARVVAGFIDLVVGSLLTAGLTYLIWQVGGRPVLTSALIAFAVVVGLRWLAIATTGWSLGGLLLKVRMLGARHQTPSPLGSFLHADLILAVSVTTLGLGTIALIRSAGADPQGRGWHDKLSGMALLRTRKEEPPSQGAVTGDPSGRSEAASAPTGATDTPGAAGRDDTPHSSEASSRSASGSSTGSTADPASGSTSGSEAAVRAALYIQPTERPASGDASVSQSDSSPEPESASRSGHRRGPRAGKKREKASKRTFRARSASKGTTDAESAGDTEPTVGAQSATEAGVAAAPGGTALPTASDPVHSSIRRPRPARPGQPARRADRALASGSRGSSSSQKASTTTADGSTAAGTTASADGYGIIQAPRTARAAKAATVSSSATSAASAAYPDVSDTDAAAVAAASAAPMDPQTTALPAPEASNGSEARTTHPARPAQSVKSADRPADTESVQEPSTGSAESSRTNSPESSNEVTAQTADEVAGSADATATAALRPRSAVRQPLESGPAEPNPSGSRKPAPVSSQMDAETATLDAVEDTPQPTESSSEDEGAEGASTNEPASAQHPVIRQPPEARTPSAESSGTPADSETSRASSSQDATPSTQVPRSKATKPVTSQTMEPRHAHAQRWRSQSGNAGKKTSGSPAAPAEDQREPASQPGVPRRESLFTSERHRFAAGAGSAPEVAHTFDTSSILPSGDRNTQALIDSVPWSSVPTSVDAATVDSLPEGAIISEDGSPRKASPASARPDLTSPATVPGGLPASTAGNAHPTVRSHRSHAQTSGGANGSASAITPEAASRPTHTAHRFQGPGIPEPAEGRSRHSGSYDDSQARLLKPPVLPHETDASFAQAAAQPQTSPAVNPLDTASPRTRRSASSAGSTPTTSASAPTTSTSASPIPAVGAQAATPSLPSASSAAPALSVRLVPLLGGNPILIHEPTVVGRDPDNISAYPGAERVALDDPTRSVSKTHAAIFPLLDGVWVTDLHSTNGTRVEHRDGRSIEAVPDKALSALEGSTVFFGRIAFKVEVV